MLSCNLLNTQSFLPHMQSVIWYLSVPGVCFPLKVVDFILIVHLHEKNVGAVFTVCLIMACLTVPW